MAEEKISGFDKVMQQFREQSRNTRNKGTLFEEFMKKYFSLCPPYSEIYEEIWMWSDFPYKNRQSDYGIDLVAKIKDCDEYVAIQCKFYEEDTEISKADVDTFIAASSRFFYVDGKRCEYTDRIFVSTSDKWSKTAELEIKCQNSPVTRIRLQELRNSNIDWDNFTLNNIQGMKLGKKKELRKHQSDALDAVIKGFETADRGKLIMACGTGKTFTSLKIAEAMTKGNGSILYLVPSISLLNQTLLDWCNECSYDYSVFAVCSDPKASQNDSDSKAITDTIIPATTSVEKLVDFYNFTLHETGMKLFFSTYQSIDVIRKFQEQTDLTFDVIICDEAHRTTGVTLAENDESEFVRIHDKDYIHGKKRLYMTATPRIYGDSSKSKAKNKNAVLCSMDDEELYGKEFYNLSFSEAVDKNLLSDYKVIVLAVDENYVSKSIQNIITNDDGSELNIEDSAKIIGCLSGLSKKTTFASDEDYFVNDPKPMKRAVAFAGRKKISKSFVKNCGLIQDELKKNDDYDLINVELEHIDGDSNAIERKKKIDWLKEDIPDGTCRLLSNPKCLSEGIDVPALDAVIFLNSNKSKVDIIQAVGRVMRKTDGKNFGYVILPIAIPSGVKPEEALDENKNYDIIWDVLQALRAHDNRFDITINQIDLNKKRPDSIKIIGIGGLDSGENEENENNNNNTDNIDNFDGTGEQITFDEQVLKEWNDAIYAKIVKKCGEKGYWEDWSKDVADIAMHHMDSINKMIDNGEITQTFNNFLSALRANLNSTITQQDAVEMLAEHLVTRPVFEALFDNYDFIGNNPVSKIMQDMINTLDDKFKDNEKDTLDIIATSVKRSATGIDNSEGKQAIIKKLYEEFFKNALEDTSKRLGIVYTPNEVVNFIIQSVEVLLKDRFGSSFNDNGVHVLDPFTGTGTFIVQLLRSGLIKPENLQYKYQNELHANEIVLLAYYIAAINIEETYHDITKAEEYTPFDGIVLTDTFELSENAGQGNGESGQTTMFKANSDRAAKELQTPITVIIGNPPYSTENQKYKNLDDKINSTYIARSNGTSRTNAHDSYIKSFRWATDRIGDNGVIGYITNGSFIDGASLDGFRESLLEDFNSVYVFNLRGGIRNTMQTKNNSEGENIFDVAVPVAITFLIKQKNKPLDGYVNYYDIGENLTREKKIDNVKKFKNINGIKWNIIKPNSLNDWINQRLDLESWHFDILGKKKKVGEPTYFDTCYSTGIKTHRNAWLYNFTKVKAIQSTTKMIKFFNNEVDRCNKVINEKQQNGEIGTSKEEIMSVLRSMCKKNDNPNINWSDKLREKIFKKSKIDMHSECRKVLFRPFCKEVLVYNQDSIEVTAKWENIFPTTNTRNLVICISAPPMSNRFSTIITDCMVDYDCLIHAQCFPMYYFDSPKKTRKTQLSFDVSNEGNSVSQKHYALSDSTLKKFRNQYGDNIKHEDIFYYIYAVLQNNEYIDRYSAFLKKEMPRIPMLKDFKKYSEIGRKLANLHLHYDDEVDPASIPGLNVSIRKENYYVEKMHFTDKYKKDNLIFNDYITISGIPEETYKYKLNGLSPLDWVMSQYVYKYDSEKDIIYDPNTYSTDEKYIFNLVISAIHLSLETQKLIDSMPPYEEIE